MWLRIPQTIAGRADRLNENAVDASSPPCRAGDGLTKSNRFLLTS
jgi:hypothetical protein